MKRLLRRLLRAARLEMPAQRIYDALFAAEPDTMDPRDFAARYGAVDRYELVMPGFPRVVYTTADDYSKHWFFPRYDGGRIHEEPVTRLFVERAAEANCIVDVGAHLGWFSCIAGALRPQASVVAFEMDERNFDILQRNIRLNELTNVQAVRAAVSARPGPLVYHRHVDQPSPEFRLESPLGEGMGAAIRVDGVSLDSFFEGRSDWPDLIKIDVEGAELQVLEGMRETIRTARPTIFVEVHPLTMGGFGASVGAVIALLVESGHQVHEIEGLRGPGQVELHPIDASFDTSANTMLYAEPRGG